MIEGKYTTDLVDDVIYRLFKTKGAKIAELTALKKHVFNYVGTRDVLYSVS